MGTLAVATKGQWMAGVSTDINATFVRPAGKLGDTVFMETRVTGIGEPPTLSKVLLLLGSLSEHCRGD